MRKNVIIRAINGCGLYRIILWSTISCLSVLLIKSAEAVETTVYGDGVLHLGTNGFASIPDSQFQGFNSQTNLSLEVVLNIKAHAAGGRWPVLLGKKYSPPFTDAGFALSINQGQFKSMGQQLYATVADGTNQAAVASRYFQGIIHAVMTWDCQAKVLSLYINGAPESSVTNTLLSANLQNAQSFQVGGPSNYGQTLQRDILLGRLWNRVLTAGEVAALWANFNNSGQHILPASFDRTALVSEWLMQDLADATHLQDTRGGNALQLQGSAQLWQGNGALTLAVPANGGTNVPTAVTLKAVGGMDTLGGSVVRPLQYYFEVDQTDTFNSSALISSGWRADYGAWKPLLKPATQYFVRVRVQDSASTPKQSGFITTNAFITKSPSDWYVRPGVYTQSDPNSGIPIPTAGVYGRQDGTSYTNAWNGLFSVVWGEDGVEAGDNLYVCGTHLYAASNNVFLATQGLNYITESGYSTDYPITIRMDSPSEAGVVWGARLNGIGGGTWYGPDANGVYRSSNLLYSADYWANGTNVVLLNRESATTWINDPGATFASNGVWYVKSPDGSNPAGKICTDGLGYQWNFGRAWYLRFLNCHFFDSTPDAEVLSRNPNNDTQTAVPVSSYITFDNCTLQYNASITLSTGNDHWTLRNSEIGNSPYGIYSFLNNHNTGADYLTVQDNYIHDIGTSRFLHVDAHGVGVQGGTGHLIENNQIENTGSAIEFYTVYQPMRNHTIRYNFIKNIRVIPNGTDGGGITISGDNTLSVPGLRTGFEIYGNIIMNTGLGGTQPWQGYGIASGSPDFVDIYNNVLYQDPTGIAVISVNNPAQARVVNNIIVNSTNRFLTISGSGPSTNLFVDYNLYFPAAISSSSLISVLYNSHDQHSVFANPSFVSSAPVVATDFKVAPGSKAVAAGIPIEPLYDFGGLTLVPSGSRPDIGAFEDFSTDGRPRPPSNLRVNTVTNN